MSEVPPPVPPGEGDANHGKQDASRLDRLSRTPVPQAIKPLGKDWGRSIDTRVDAHLVPNLKEDNIKAWELGRLKKWAEMKSTTEHSVFTYIKKRAENAEKIRNEGNS